MKPIDPAWRVAFEQARERAAKVGHDPLEHLNAKGFLLTPEARRVITIATLTHIHALLDTVMTPAALLNHYTGRGHGTPEDMHRAVVLWLEQLIEFNQRSAAR